MGHPSSGKSSPLLRGLIDQGILRVAGGYFDIRTGVATILDGVLGDAQFTQSAEAHSQGQRAHRRASRQATATDAGHRLRKKAR